jgi:hypothetical protein
MILPEQYGLMRGVAKVSSSVCRVAIGTTFNGGGHKFRFAATKDPRQCPLVLLVKVALVKVRRLEVEKLG